MPQLPIASFLTEALFEFDPTFELRVGTGFENLFFEPLQFIVQPLRDEFNDIFVGQSFLRILSTDNPDSFPTDKVDALTSNIFVDRREGGYSSGLARVYYNQPQQNEYPAGGAEFTGSNGLTYSNPQPFLITEQQMAIQVDVNGLYYMDVPIQSDNTGANTALPIDGIVSLANDANYVFVTNTAAIEGGLDTETNTALITRCQNSIGVRDLVTPNGFTATMFQNFTATLLELQPIGFNDPEMMRDIVYNVHVGGKVDGFVKTGTIAQGSANFVGLLLDTTRQAYSSTNVAPVGTAFTSLNITNIDRSNNLPPIVSQIKPTAPATFTSSVAITGTIDLSAAQYVQLTIDGVNQTIRLAAPIPTATTLDYIITAINGAFGYTLATAAAGGYLKLTSQISGLASSIIIANPVTGTSALLAVFGLATVGSPYTYSGIGPIVWVEGVNYNIDDIAGEIQRIIGPSVVTARSTGTTIANSPTFNDPTSNIFLDVAVNDIVTVTAAPYVFVVSGAITNPSPGNTYSNNGVVFTVVSVTTVGAVTYLVATGSSAPTASGALARLTGAGSNPINFSKFISIVGDYRVIGLDTVNQVTLDANMPPVSLSAVSYFINRTGIKSGELIYVQFYYNPLSIDIGNMVIINQTLGTRGIRPGRAGATITDLPILKINSIVEIDPVTQEPTGVVLNGDGGFGRGGFGEGGFGIGSDADYRLIVNVPTARFSMFEDSFIVIDQSFQGLSFQVNYDWAPDVSAYHTFVRSDGSRTLDGDILMRHFLPAYVSGTITYSFTTPDTTVPNNAALLPLLQNYIATIPHGQPLNISQVEQFIISQLDPFGKYDLVIQPITLTATIYNTDGSTTIISSNSQLIVPTLNPFPSFTVRPISPRIVHWIPDLTNLVLVGP